MMWHAAIFVCGVLVAAPVGLTAVVLLIVGGIMRSTAPRRRARAAERLTWRRAIADLASAGVGARVAIGGSVRRAGDQLYLEEAASGAIALLRGNLERVRSGDSIVVLGAVVREVCDPRPHHARESAAPVWLVEADEIAGPDTLEREIGYAVARGSTGAGLLIGGVGALTIAAALMIAVW